MQWSYNYHVGSPQFLSDTSCSLTLCHWPPSSSAAILCLTNARAVSFLCQKLFRVSASSSSCVSLATLNLINFNCLGAVLSSGIALRPLKPKSQEIISAGESIRLCLEVFTIKLLLCRWWRYIFLWWGHGPLWPWLLDPNLRFRFAETYGSPPWCANGDCRGGSWNAEKETKWVPVELLPLLSNPHRCREIRFQEEEKTDQRRDLHAWWDWYV